MKNTAVITTCVDAITDHLQQDVNCFDYFTRLLELEHKRQSNSIAEWLYWFLVDIDEYVHDIWFNKWRMPDRFGSEDWREYDAWQMYIDEQNEAYGGLSLIHI